MALITVEIPDSLRDEIRTFAKTLGGSEARRVSMAECVRRGLRLLMAANESAENVVEVGDAAVATEPIPGADFGEG